MAKAKRYQPEKKSNQTSTTPAKGGRLGPFLEDWGRLVIPLGLVAVLAALRFAGLLDDTSMGLAIGLVVLLGLAAAWGIVVWRGEFPGWVRGATIGMFAVYAAGCLLPFVMTIYPGSPDFTQDVAKGNEFPLTGVGSGFYTVEVYASELADKPEARTEGAYKLAIGSIDISGKFSDTMQTVRGRKGSTRQVEQKHLMEVHTVVLPEGEKTLKAVRIDPSIGSFIRVQLFPTLIPPWVAYIVFALTILLGALIDGMFQEATEKWRLAPWMTMATAFVLIFHSAYERGNVTSAAVWSTIFGGVGGFMAGWVVSWIGRKIVGKVRAKV